MRGNRRLLTFFTRVTISRFVCFCAYITIGTCSLEHPVPIEIKLWDTGRTPLAHMVDVTNEFGLKVLAEHNFLNDNNIAFSPYGLMGIMVALYEGVDGECSYQMQRAMQLPRNRQVMRVGFRDIHRTLKTYFVPEEGFLAGLALNNENVTFNEQYKKTLRFYGFDLENDQLPTLSPDKNNASNVENSTLPTVTLTTSAVSSTISIEAQSTPGQVSTTSSNREDTTTNPNAETIDTIDIRGPTTTIAIPPSALNSEISTLINAVSALDTTTSEIFTETLPFVVSQADSISADVPTITSIQITTMQILEEPAITVSTPITATSTESTTQSITNKINPEQSTTETSQSIATQTEIASLMSNSLTNELTTKNNMDTSPTDNDMISSQTTSMQTTTESVLSTQLTTDTSSITSFVNTESTTTDVTASLDTQQTDVTSTTPTDMSTATDSVTTNNSTLEILERRKKSIVDFIFTNPPYVDDNFYYRSYDVGSDINKPNFDDEMFLANGLNNVQVTYMRYETVLEYAYLPHLEAAALRLPLDSDRYYLLVVLPKRRGPAELTRLISRMARESDLSDIYSVLRPRRVRGTVPSFNVKGHITLTTDLQKMGIRDVFEPRQRDFGPMTNQAGVYVRSIEQAVSVAIRKYQQHDQKKHRYVTNRDPVIFPATYPFVYFVMDANIHVALMAGKMVDPLNSRIL